MIWFLLSLFLQRASPRSLLASSISAQIISYSLFDEAKCCESINCYHLGDGICNEALNTVFCSWDMGDCEYCSPNCYLSMLDNGICDEECFTSNCLYDKNDCEKRKLVKIYDPSESLNQQHLNINGKSVNVSTEVEGNYEHFVFNQIKILIEFNIFRYF